jgi:tetratricopeptide (TPR) repeat protein
MGHKMKIGRGTQSAAGGQYDKDDAGKRATISACLIVKNEQESLPRCLESIADIMDEIVVVDTGSSDRTIEIAEEFGCRVFRYTWTGDFSAARNESIKHAANDWLFIIDADEELPGGESEKLRAIISKTKADIVSLTVYNKSPESGRVSSILPSVRLFRRQLGLRYEGIVHNRLTLPANIPVMRSDLSLYHYGYDLSQEKLREKRERSRALLEMQLETNPDDVFANFNMAQLLIGLHGTAGRHTCEQIIDHAGRVIGHADPGQTGQAGYRLMAHHQMAVALSALSQYEEARQHCLEALAEKEDYLDALLTLANIYLAEADLANARTCYERFLTAVETYRPEAERHDIIMHYLHGRHIAHYGLGTIYRLEGRVDEALKEFFKVVRECPSYLDTGYQIGALHLDRNEPARAEDILTKEIEHNPDSIAALKALARAVELQGRGDRAVAYLETALIKVPHDSEVLLQLAHTLIRLGKRQGATKYLETILTAVPANPRTAFAAAGLYFDIGDYEKSQSLYRVSLEHKPVWPEAYTNLGNCFFKQEQYEEARAAYETALALKPGSRLPLRNLALTYAREHKYSRAIDILQEHAEAMPDSNDDISRLIGDLHSLSRNYPEAIRYYERHLSAHPSDTDCLFQIAEAYRKSGHYESAVAGYRYLLHIIPDHEAAQKRLELIEGA